MNDWQDGQFNRHSSNTKTKQALTVSGREQSPLCRCFSKLKTLNNNVVVVVVVVDEWYVAQW